MMIAQLALVEVPVYAVVDDSGGSSQDLEGPDSSYGGSDLGGQVAAASDDLEQISRTFNLQTNSELCC